MKKKKYRILSLLLALGLLLAAQPVLAEGGDPPIVVPTPTPPPREYPSDKGNANGSAEVSVTLNASPSYTLVIPPYIKAGNNGMIYQYDEAGKTIPFEISIKDCKEFETGLYRLKVTVTGSGGLNNDEFLLYNTDTGPKVQLAYSVYKKEANGGFTEVQPNGEFASFSNPSNETESKAAGKVVLVDPERLQIQGTMNLNGTLYFSAEVVNKDKDVID